MTNCISKNASSKKRHRYDSFSDFIKNQKTENDDRNGLVTIVDYEHEEKPKEVLKILSCERCLKYKRQIDLDESITRIKNTYQIISHQPEIDFSNAIGDFVDTYLIGNVPQMVFSSMENRVKITDNAKKVLEKDVNLLFSLRNVINNISSCDIKKFEFDGIEVFNDPENPDWAPIEIYIRINSDNFMEKLDIKHRIIDKAFIGVNNDIRKKIFIMGLM